MGDAEETRRERFPEYVAVKPLRTLLLSREFSVRSTLVKHDLKQIGLSRAVSRGDLESRIANLEF